MRVYFARPENVAGTELERSLLARIRSSVTFHRYQVVCPSFKRTPYTLYDREFKEHLLKIAASCTGLVFLAFNDRMIHFRHEMKIRDALSMNRKHYHPVYEIAPDGNLYRVHDVNHMYGRVLSREDTANRLWDDWRFLRPYT